MVSDVKVLREITIAGINQKRYDGSVPIGVKIGHQSSLNQLCLIQVWRGWGGRGGGCCVDGCGNCGVVVVTGVAVGVVCWESSI